MFSKGGVNNEQEGVKQQVTDKSLQYKKVLNNK